MQHCNIYIDHAYQSIIFTIIGIAQVAMVAKVPGPDSWIRMNVKMQ